MNHPILEGLNEKQREAVVTTEGALMILAGAGSGKTRTIVKRIQYLLEVVGASPHQILALTFSNKAAREMRERISEFSKLDVGALNVTTFHSFSARMLRFEANYLGLSKNFSIYDEGESKAVAKAILAKRGISDKILPPVKVLYYIDDLKNNGYYPGCKKRDDFEIDKSDELYPYYEEYENELHRSNAVDFGGLIVGVLQLFETHNEVLERYQRRFKYILVDEYQDTNRSQFHLINMLSGMHRNVCVVGDEDQSIYSWRGADIRNILDYEKVFPDSKVIKLEQNYRSTKNIIEAASCVISNNQMRKGKEMWTDNSAGESVSIVECSNDRSEAEFVGEEVSSLLNKGTAGSEIAVFYRNNSQSRMFEDVLRKRNIYYRVIGGMKFYERKEIKDMLAYMRVVVNPKDSLAISRIINVPTRGIGVTTLRKIEEEAANIQGSLWDVLHKNEEHLKFSGKIQTSLSSFVSLIEEVRILEENTSKEKILPSFMYEKLLNESGYLDSLKADKSYESKDRIEHLEELMSAMKQYETSEERPNLSGFLETVTLDTTVEGDEESLEKKQEDISLMTVHGAKGLEYSYVFVVGAEETLFPSYRSLEEGGEKIEEERRLFYVAMTRAMKRLHITFANGRMLWGQLKFNGPSRFIDEIPDKYYAWKKYASPFDEKKFEKKWDNCDPEYSDELPSKFIKKPERTVAYPVGTKVIHTVYGKGTVTQVEGNGTEEKVLIRFIDGAQKKFMVKFAPLSKA